MRISVNLATRPFVELGPFFLRLRLLMGLLAVVGVGAIVWAHVLQTHLDQAQRQMDAYASRSLAAQQEKQSNERRMRQPVNAEVLDRAHFLNGLFLRKSFSWTAVMMDLETVLPVGVQVTSIEPQISSDGDVVIRLRVSGDRDKAVQLVRNLERSKRFLQPRLTGESVQARTPAQQNAQQNVVAAAALPDGGVEFEILANYNPLPEGQTYTKTVAAAKAGSSSIKAASPGIKTGPPAAKGSRHSDGIVLKPYSATHPKPQTSLKSQPGGVR